MQKNIEKMQVQSSLNFPAHGTFVFYCPKLSNEFAIYHIRVSIMLGIIIYLKGSIYLENNASAVNVFSLFFVIDDGS